MEVKITVNDGLMVAKLSGEIDHHMAPKIREEIDSRIDSARPKSLILDYAEVSFMDSSGIGLVMGRYKQMKEINGNLKLRNTSQHITKVMKLAGLDRLAEIENETKRGDKKNDVK